MRKIIVSLFVTLDGYISGLNGETDWVITDKEMQDYSAGILDSVDTMLLGRKTYQLFVEHWPTATGESADKLNAMPKIVFSKTLESVEWGNWNNVRLVTDDIAGEISKLKQQPGKDMVIFAGADIVQTFMKLGLVDEYQLLVHPVVLGSGKPLFDNLTQPVNLSLLRTIAFHNGVVVLYYAPSKVSN